MKNILLLFALCLCFIAPAYADYIPMPPELQHFLMRPDQQREVVGRMAAQWKTIIPDCPTPKLDRTNVLIYAAPAFNNTGDPVSGEWRIIGHMSGCEKTRILQVYFAFTHDGRMMEISLLPGTSMADPLLEHDALMYAFMGMLNIEPKHCKDQQVTDTAFVRLANDAASRKLPAGKKPWLEKWTVRACGVTGLVKMHFIPDATGTTIQSSPSETKKL